MNFDLPGMAIRRPVATLMVVLLVILLGCVALANLALDLLPNVTFPVAIVMTRYSGAGPQEIEQLVTRPLEEALGTVNRIRRVSSQTQEELSVVVCEFNWGTDMDFAALDMREKVDQVRRFLPGDADAPTVVKIDPALMPCLELSLSGGGDLLSLREMAEDRIKGRLERLDGVASVQVVGGTQREVRVTLDLEKLQGHGLSIGQVTQAVGLENLNLPGGRLEEAKKKLLVRTLGEFRSLDDIRHVTLPTAAGATVEVGELGRVEMGQTEASELARLNGNPSLGIVVQKRPDANTVEVTSRVLQAMEALQAELPPDLEVGVAMSSSEYIVQAINNVVSNAVVGAILAVLVLYLFLYNFRTTFIIATAIPVSIVATFTLVYFSGLTLNLMSLGGLALGVGMLVDNSIVVLENIFRHRQEGEDAFTAARRGALEVANAITGSTLTTVAVFLPVVFLQGLASELFRELALTVSFSLLASLVVALTVVPVLASRLFAGAVAGVAGAGSAGAAGGAAPEGGAAATGGAAAAGSAGRAGADRPPRRSSAALGAWLKDLVEGRLRQGYRRLLSWCLGHRRLVLALAAVLFLGSAALVPLIGTEFMPPMDTGQFVVDVELPRGSVLAETDRLVKVVEDRVLALTGVQTVFTTAGASSESMFFSGGTGSDLGSVRAHMVPRRQRPGKERLFSLVDRLRDRFGDIPGARVETTAFSGMMGALAGAPIAVNIKGDDIHVLAGLADEVAGRVAGVAGTREVEAALVEGQPEARLVVDRQQAAYYGLSVAQVAAAVRSAVHGDVATRYRLPDGSEIDVRVRAEESARQDLRAVENLVLSSPYGFQVPLRDVARVELAPGPTSISREGQVRMATVTAEVSGRALGRVTRDIQAALADLDLGPGYSVEYAGEAREMNEAFGTLGYALILAVVLVYMILAAEFESLLHPFTIMLTVPLAFIGVSLSLALTGRTLNLTSYIGVIMLAGIVVNNAIVLVDYLNQLRARGLDRREAILRAGATRLRPILMTSLTTVLGLLPLALGLGEGAEMQAPLATVVIGGLTFSTFLTLVVLPLVYEVFDDWAAALRGRRGRAPA